ncbi:MAG: DUF4389 domain-containing protein [Deltaproteobacteria bacterium]|nr:DUF4389 domain-containing protein [Deltaproteobacteria bacterium]
MSEIVTEIERKDTGIRLLFTLLFVFILHAVEIVLAVTVLFSLAVALITKRPPGERVRQFANRTLSYLYRIVRYLTYNDHQAPFPFADFPPEVEPPTPFRTEITEDPSTVHGRTTP